MHAVHNVVLPSVVRGTGPGLVLVHGAGATGDSTYGRLISGLAAGHGVVAPDYSKLTTGATVDIDALADWHVEAALRAGHERFAMAGHSLGSMIATRAAVRHPDRVTALVLTSAFARAPASTRLKLRVWRGLLDGGRGLLARYLMSLMLSDRYLDAMSEDQIDGFAELVALTTGAGSAEQIELALRLDVRADLARISVPTLVIATSDDHLVPAAVSGELIDHLSAAVSATLPCGHLPALECPQEWQRLIEDFLTAVNSDGAAQ
ncbi:alpha/beta hydrolase [Solwaraspora sp. WMMD937]|uniref:alpha/beta fold hydrolase n=1 Tax=Solwaraspora sp. WMMD937 TaxID=3016090 RepID=UPI00249C8F34|nr:alpha/beta hydrolase [Solwaraspora sp. WMMD937]WFE22953.1 alpha/beta hydrolase [Solwaraspora sp. WMMD937]